MSAFFLGLLWLLREIYTEHRFLGTQSEFPRLHVTTVTNDEVQEYHAGLFAFDAIQRIDEWRAAMLADPNHTRKFSKQDATEQFLSARGSIVSLKEPCLGCAVIKTFVKIGVGIGHTATGGKFLRRGHEKRVVHRRVRYGVALRG
jgi:hypothetical protein